MASILTVDDSASILQAIKIALSGEGYAVTDAEIKAQAKTAGATGWLTKPFDPEQLVRVVKKVLAK